MEPPPDAQAVEVLGVRLARVKGFDFAAFGAQLRVVIDSAPRKQKALQARLEEIWAEDIERLERQEAARDPWDALGVDWKKQHPKARQLLPDVFFWDPAGDLAPIGNDSGADVLERYKSWRSRNKGKLAGACSWRPARRRSGANPPGAITRAWFDGAGGLVSGLDAKGGVW